MIALWKKDRIWLATAALIGFVTWNVVFHSHNLTDWWMGAERNSTEQYFLVAGIGALLFGLYAGMRDRLLGTREYLLHRPVAAGRIFRARVVACLAVLSFVLLAAPLLSWLLPHENKAIWEFKRFGYFAAMSTSAWGVFAVGMFAATGTGSLARIVLQAALLGGIAMWFAWRMLFPWGDGLFVSPWVYAGLQMAFAAALLWVVARRFVRGPDADRDMARGTRVPLAIALSVAAVVGATLGLGEAQRGAYRAGIVRKARDSTENAIAQLDDEHRIDFSSVYFAPWPRPDRMAFVNPDRALRLPAGRDERGHMLGERVVQLGRKRMAKSNTRVSVRFPEGRVHIHVPSRMGHPPVVADGEGSWELNRTVAHSWSSARGDGRPFSPRTAFRWDRVLFALDYGDRTLWSMRMAPGASFERVTDMDGEVLWRLMISHQIKSPTRVLVVTTDVAEYTRVDGVFAREPKEPPTSVPANPEEAKVVVSLDMDDPLAPRLTAHRGDELVTQHAIDGSLISQLAVRTFTVLRAPALSAASLLSGTLVWPLDPILFSGHHTWLFVAGLFLSFLLAWVAAKRLHDAGARKGVRRLWVLLIVLGGLGAFIAHYLLETHRAHRGVKTIPVEDLPPLRIQTA